MINRSMCGFCYRQFEMLKRWRIYTSKMRKQDEASSFVHYTHSRVLRSLWPLVTFCYHPNSPRHRKQWRSNFMLSTDARGPMISSSILTRPTCRCLSTSPPFVQAGDQAG
uniref:Uncharacterized protein n=1 Tax=Elaeophora elaphi TaxID=1147741 RepID=A0A0R3RNH2_9BILA